MTLTGQGPMCGYYGPVSLPLDVAPLMAVVGSDSLWWFGGQQPDGASITTTTASTTAHATEAAFSAVSGDVSVTATVNGVSSDAVFLTVRKPHFLKRKSNEDKANGTYGYVSQVHYAIFDQLGIVLPSIVPVNEHFTSDVAIDFVGTNWRRGPEGGNPAYPNDWFDRVGGEASVMLPTPQAPQSPVGTVKIEHWSGEWSVGSTSIGVGLRVQTNTWQKFQDHARHTQLVSPAP